MELFGVLLVILAVLGVGFFASGGADRLERHLQKRADAAQAAAAQNVTPINRDLDASIGRHPSGRG